MTSSRRRFGPSGGVRVALVVGFHANSRRERQQRSADERGTTADERCTATAGFLSGQILACFYRVYNGLGFGFLESVYCNALAQEFRRAGLSFTREAPIDVWYGGTAVGQFRADFMVDQRIILEVKASQMLTEADRRQLFNYLRGSDMELGLLLHFGPKPSHNRLVYTNKPKTH